MTSKTFFERIEAGKSNSYCYSSGGKEGLVAVWKNGGVYILTWEECPPGGQYDESSYTRDEIHRFGDADQLIAFLLSHGIKASAFTP